MNLEMEIQSLTNTIGILSNNNTNTDLERDLELSIEREKLLDRTVASKDQQIRELTTKIRTGPDDTVSVSPPDIIAVFVRKIYPRNV